MIFAEPVATLLFGRGEFNAELVLGGIYRYWGLGVFCGNLFYEDRGSGCFGWDVEEEI